MGQIQYTTALVLVAIFSIAVFSYVLNFADDNNVYIDLQNDSQIVTIKDNMESNITLYKTDVNSTSAKFQEIRISDSEATSTSLIGSSDDSPKKIGFSALTLAFYRIFGENTGFGIILTIITTTIAFFGVLYIIKTLKGGNPE